MSHWDRLPEELQTRIWKTYFQTHVLPYIRRPLDRHLRRLVRRLHGATSTRGSESVLTFSTESESVLTFWTELVACHWRTLEEAHAHLERTHPGASILRRYDDGTTKLFWTYIDDATNEHLLSATQDSDRYYISYHGPSTYETVVVDMRSYEMGVHSRMLSTRTARPQVLSWNRRLSERIAPDSTLHWA